MTLPELVSRSVRARATAFAARTIRSLGTDGDYERVLVAGGTRPLAWPSSVDRAMLHQIIPELCDPHDWHYYETPETHVEPNDIVADCGAAEGLFGLLVQHRARHVYMIEPTPIWIRALERTFQGVENVTVLPVAVGAAPGHTNIIAWDSPTTSLTEHVPVETIDGLFAARSRPLTYIKADLEGAEMGMLHGARETIRLNRPKVAITTYHKATHAQEIAELLRAIHPDYRIRVKGISHYWGNPMMLHAW